MFIATIRTNTSFGNLSSFVTILLLHTFGGYLISYFFVYFLSIFVIVFLGKLCNLFKRSNYERHTDDNDNNVIIIFSFNFHLEFNKSKNRTT